MAEQHEPEGFEQAKETAERFARDHGQTTHLMQEAIAKAEQHRKVLSKIWDDLQTLFRMVRASAAGDYTRLPWQTLVFAVAAVVYFVNPFDLIPDFFPASGFLDDATVIGFVIKSIKSDLDTFLIWEEAVDE